jgi:hypothetical protein
MVLLALRPEFSTSARMPPTARFAPRGGRQWLAVLTAGLEVPLGRLLRCLGGFSPCPTGNGRGIEFRDSVRRSFTDARAIRDTTRSIRYSMPYVTNRGKYHGTSRGPSRGFRVQFSRRPGTLGAAVECAAGERKARIGLADPWDVVIKAGCRFRRQLRC